MADVRPACSPLPLTADRLSARLISSSSWCRRGVTAAGGRWLLTYHDLCPAVGVIRCIPASLQVSLEVKSEGQGRAWRSEVKDSRSVINNGGGGHCCRQQRRVATAGFLFGSSGWSQSPCVRSVCNSPGLFNSATAESESASFSLLIELR